MIFDLILVAIFALCLYRGWRKGLIRMALNIASLIIALVITFFARDVITEFAMTLPFATTISSWVYQGADTLTNGIASLPFVSGAMDTAIHSATFIIVQILVMIFVFAIATLILGLICRCLQRLLRVVKLGFIDSTVGLLLGGIKGYIIIYFVTIGAFALSVAWPWLVSAMSGSIIANNLINPFELAMGLLPTLK